MDKVYISTKSVPYELVEKMYLNIQKNKPKSKSKGA